LCFLTEITSPYSLNAQRWWHTSELRLKPDVMYLFLVWSLRIPVYPTAVRQFQSVISFLSSHNLSERRSRSASCTCEPSECYLYRQLARDAPVACAKRMRHASRVVFTLVIYLTVYFLKFCCPFSNLLTDFCRVTPTVLTCLLYEIHQISYLLGTRGENGRFLKLASHLLLLHLDMEFFTRNEGATWPVPKGPSAFLKHLPFNREL